MMTTNLPRESGTKAAAGFTESRQPGYWILAGTEAPLLAYTTRLGGASEGAYASLNLGLSTGDDRSVVEQNRARLCRALGVDAPATLAQVHGAEVREVDAGGPAGRGDVLVTERPDLALAVSTADCLGVVLWDERRTALAAVHAGWRGVVAGALEAALDWLRSRRPDARLRAVLGPALGVCCFEVGPEVAERFPAEAIRPGPRRPHLDLAGAARARLLAGGLPPDAVQDLGVCTSCAPERFFSHRRDRGTTGRHWVVARLEPARGHRPV